MPKVRRIYKASKHSKIVTLPKAFAGQIGDNVVIYLSEDKRVASVVLVDVPKPPKNLPIPEETAK